MGSSLFSSLEAGAQIEIDLAGRQSLHQPQGRSAQGKRIFGAGGRQPGCKHPGQRIQPVSQADDQSRPRLRQDIAGKARQVVLEDGLATAWLSPEWSA